MQWQLNIVMNEHLYLRDPEQSELGKNILRKGAELIDSLGLEDFTFRKLAKELNTNESSIYRYFENKHRLLIYISNWYWNWLEYQVIFHTNNLESVTAKLEIVLDILLMEPTIEFMGAPLVSHEILHRIVIKEGAKAYLTNHVTEDNQHKLFKPYKDLCALIADILLEKDPTYKFPRSLTSTLIEMAHYQYYFMNNLPALTDFGETRDKADLKAFLRSLVNNSIGL